MERTSDRVNLHLNLRIHRGVTVAALRRRVPALGLAALFCVLWGNSGCSSGSTDSTSDTAGGDKAGGDDAKTSDKSKTAQPSDEDARACGQPVDGERLVMRGWSGEDGSWEREEWYDTELEVPCRFLELASDGVPRCIPVSETTHFGDLEHPYYLDVGCTDPVATIPRFPCDEEVAWDQLIAATAGECDEGRLHVYPLQEVLVQPAALYLEDAEGNCVSDSSTDPSEWRIFDVLEEVPPESFVGVSFEARGERLQRLVTVAEDGASEFAEPSIAYDETLGNLCFADRAEDGELRCLPLTDVGVEYSETPCEAPLGRLPDSPPDPLCSDDLPIGPWTDGWRHYGQEPVFSGSEPIQCRPRLIIYSVDESAEESAPESTFYKDPYTQECIEASSGTGLNYLPASRVPPESFVLMSYEPTECDPVRSSGSRLESLSYVTEDGTHLSSRFFDSELEQPCSIVMASDSVMRCLPGLGVASNSRRYADASCTNKAAELRTPVACPFEQAMAGPPKFAEVPDDELADDGTFVCGPTLQIYELLEPDLSTVYELDPDGNCVQADPESLPLDATFREVGSEVPPSRFVAFSLTQ